MDWIAFIKEEGDIALKQIYQENRIKSLQWLKAKHSLNEDDAKEVFQLSLIVLYDNVVNGKLIDLTSDIGTYLNGIARIQALAFKRKTTTENLRRDGLIKSVLYDNHDDFKIKEVLLDKIDDALNKLGPPCQLILQLFYHERQSMQIITEKVGYNNADTTKAKKYQCLKKLSYPVKNGAL